MGSRRGGRAWSGPEIRAVGPHVLLTDPGLFVRCGPSWIREHTYLRDTLIPVETRNVTFNLPSNLMRQAKIYAAEHDTTVNALVRELLEQKVSAEARARAAADRLIELAERGPHSPVDPGSIRREDLYERW